MTVWAEGAEGSVQLATRVPRSLHKRLKLAAFESESTLSEWVTEALTAHLERVAPRGKGKKAAAPAAG